MTLLDWRKNPERLSLALEVLQLPTVHQMMAVMDSEHPVRNHPPAKDGFDSAYLLGFIDGFQAALNMLRSFAEPLASAPEDVETTWNVGLPEDDKPR